MAAIGTTSLASCRVCIDVCHSYYYGENWSIVALIVERDVANGGVGVWRARFASVAVALAFWRASRRFSDDGGAASGEFGRCVRVLCANASVFMAVYCEDCEAGTVCGVRHTLDTFFCFFVFFVDFAFRGAPLIDARHRTPILPTTNANHTSTHIAWNRIVS
jgi:hypothetical protein